MADDPRERLTSLADIIKVDMQLTTEEQRRRHDQAVGWAALPDAGRKSRNAAEFVRARDQGFVYFQGYFFRRPEMMNTHDMPANRLNYLRMLQEVSRPELESAGLEKLVKAEASVCYRLLRYLNSAMFGFKSEIHSVRHALSILGRTRCAAVGAAGGGSGRRTGQDQRSGAVGAGARDGSGELLAPQSSAWRVRLVPDGSAVADRCHAGNADGGVLEKIPLDHATKAVLLGQPSLLRPVYQLMLAHESGEWEAAAELSGEVAPGFRGCGGACTGRRRSGRGKFPAESECVAGTGFGSCFEAAAETLQS